jgi:hypothetical protein
MKFCKSLRSFTTYYLLVLCSNCEFISLYLFHLKKKFEKIIVLWPEFRCLIIVKVCSQKGFDKTCIVNKKFLFFETSP